MTVRKVSDGYLPVDESVGLIARFASGELEELKKRFPEYSVLLADGMKMGVGRDEALRFGIDVTVSSMRAISTGVEMGLQALRNRLRRATSMVLAGEVLSLVASASIIPVVAKMLPSFGVYFPAIMATTSLVLTAVGTRMKRNPITGQGDVSEAFSLVLGMRSEANVVLSRLEILKVRPMSAEVKREGFSLIAEGNGLAEKMREQLALLGY